jgi:nucleoid-associated protein YgaU
MPQSSVVAFDESLRGEDGSGAAEHIARVLQDSGVDVPGSLYDEALSLAQEGRLAPAAERLRMLLVLDPSDSEAALLLGKVLAERRQWQESLAQLDAAAAKGARLPRGLREEVERQLRRKVQDAEEHRARMAARERGEVRTLRQEARRLRSEGAVLEQQIEDLEKRVKMWSSATAVVAGSAAALLLAAMLFGSPTVEPEVAANDVVEATAELPTAASTETPPAAPSTAAKAPAAPAVVPAAEPTPAPVEAAAVEPVGSVVHTVKKGETLGHIAREYYGKSSEWKRILDANREVLPSASKLQPGMKLKVPR